MPPADTEPTAPRRVPVWDLGVRLFHWSAVGLVGALWYTAAEGEMEWHRACGLAMLALVLFRLTWGFAGGTQARFASFVRSPAAALGYGWALVHGRAPRYVGHNPLGGLVVLALLALLGAQALTGLFANDDIVFEGPLVRFVPKDASDAFTAWHAAIFDALLALVALHVAAALFYLLVKRENLIGPMLSGRKALAPEEAARAGCPGKAALALALLGAAGAVALALATL